MCERRRAESLRLATTLSSCSKERLLAPLVLVDASPQIWLLKALQKKEYPAAVFSLPQPQIWQLVVALSSDSLENRELDAGRANTMSRRSVRTRRAGQRTM